MSTVSELSPQVPAHAARWNPRLPLSLLQEFSTLIDGCCRVETLLAEAAQILSTVFGYPKVLVMDCVGDSLACRCASGTGWASASAQRLGEALGMLLREDPTRLGMVEPRRAGCTITQVRGASLDRLNLVLASSGLADSFSGAVLIHYPMKGHVVVALMCAMNPKPELDPEQRSVSSAAVSMLGAGIRLALKRRRLAERFRQVRQAKVAWEGTVDALPEILCVLTPDGAVTRVNRAIETWGLGSVTSATSGTLHDLLHPGCIDVECALEKRLESGLGRIRESKGEEFECPDAALDRTLRVKIGCMNERTRGANSRRSVLGPLFAVIQDISGEHSVPHEEARTEKRQRPDLPRGLNTPVTANPDLHSVTSKLADVQLELAETRRRHRLVLENTIAGLLMVTGGRIAYCNHRFEQLLGYSRGELEGTPINGLLPRGWDPSNHRTPRPGDPAASQERIYQVKRRDGATVWLRRSVMGMAGRSGHLHFITVADVTDQVDAERRARRSRRKLQQLSRSLICSQEDERKRIAGELHDGVGQSLSAVKLMMQHLLTSSGDQMDEFVTGRIETCVAKTQEMIDDIRRLSMALRPAIIDTGGLLLALNRLCQELRDMVPGLKVHWSSDTTESDIEDALKIHIFRIVQEALNNVIKHAQANSVWVRLERINDTLRLCVRDDGIGFDQVETDNWTRGLGLSSIRQRIQLHYGELEILSEPGLGTTISAQWKASNSDQTVFQRVGH